MISKDREMSVVIGKSISVNWFLRINMCLKYVSWYTCILMTWCEICCFKKYESCALAQKLVEIFKYVQISRSRSQGQLLWYDMKSCYNEYTYETLYRIIVVLSIYVMDMIKSFFVQEDARHQGITIALRTFISVSYYFLELRRRQSGTYMYIYTY